MVRALSSGSSSPELVELLRHSEHCPDCRQARQLAHAFQQDAARLRAASGLHAEAGPPPATQVWAAVQRRQRLLALDRATLFLRILKIAGILYAAFFLFWSLRTVPGLLPQSLLPGVTGKALTDLVGGAGFAAIFIGSGLLYALRREPPSTN